MAKKGKLAAVPEPEAEETEESTSKYGVEDREPGELHEAFAAWVAAEVGEKVSPRAVQLAWGLRNHFRKSSAYVPFKEARAERAAGRAAEESEEAPAKGKAKGTKAAAEPAADAAAPAKAARKRGAKAASAPF